MIWKDGLPWCRKSGRYELVGNERIVEGGSTPVGGCVEDMKGVGLSG